MININTKSIVSKILMFTIFLPSSFLMAKSTTPPMPRGGGGFDDSVVVGGAIDGSLIVLFVLALVFGIYQINKLRLIPIKSK